MGRKQVGGHMVGVVEIRKGFVRVNVTRVQDALRTGFDGGTLLRCGFRIYKHVINYRRKSIVTF